MGYYKELLADVRRTIRRIRQEQKQLKKDIKNGYYKKANEQYQLEKAKLKRITGSKYAWSLGKYPKTTENLEKLLDELKTFLAQPTITKADREQRYENRVLEFEHNWGLNREESMKFFELVNSSEMQELIEARLLDSDDVIDLAVNDNESRRMIRNLTNMNDTDRKQLSTLPKSERADFLKEVIKRK